ncbi:unnamed protein product [Mytilus coruscus]|uniref:Uncharacterized protein n=1 Tax=Mytilus coruscus TaxID=42192 RepID=A0A6J8E0A0_MYTCO|nr:unnamed protein product [Mytilus coruscus]
MTDTDTQNASVSLYRFLCQNIVGTEEQVKSLRIMNNVRDNLASHNFTEITSGSFGEGIDMRGSDLDIMYVIKYAESTRHNAVSGWLLLSSLIYKTKQYKKTLDILQYSLLKCTSEKLYQFRKLSNIHHELLTLYIFRKMPVARLCKFLLLKCIDFDQNSTLRPDEIEIEMSHPIPPVVFAHFLQFLCFYHLNDTRQVRNSLCDLQLTLEENYFIAHGFEKALSYYILGVSFQLIENFDSARQAFMQSIELNPDNENNNAYYRLSLIS